jgi:hypothetical protein
MQPLYRARIASNPSGIQFLTEREIWKNDVYTVFVNRGIPVPNIVGRNGELATASWLSIKRNDQEPVHDWRDLQYIKNQLVGEENEGCELFPAESRLVDGANQYHLWVFENTTIQFPFGFTGRMVTEKPIVEGAVQRPFPEDRKPKDLEANEEILLKYVNILKNDGNISDDGMSIIS